MASATSATRVMLPNAVMKSLHANSRCSLPFTTLHPFALLRSFCTSESVSFFAGMMASPLGPDKRGRKHYAAQAARQQQPCFSDKAFYPAHWLSVEPTHQFHSLSRYLSTQH